MCPHLGCGGEVPEGALLVDEGPGSGQEGARRHHRHPAQHGQLFLTDRFLIPVLSTSYLAMLSTEDKGWDSGDM